MSEARKNLGILLEELVNELVERSEEATDDALGLGYRDSENSELLREEFHHILEKHVSGF